MPVVQLPVILQQQGLLRSLRLLPQQVRPVRAAGYWILCYTVNDPAIVRVLFDWGVDAIVTDRLDLIASDFR